MYSELTAPDLLPTTRIPESQSQTDSAAFHTSPLSVPPSALYETQGSISGPPRPQRLEQTPPASSSIPRKSKGPTPASRATRDPPSTPRLKSVPDTSQGAGPAPRKTKGHTTSVHGASKVPGIQATTEKAGADGRWIIALQNSLLTSFLK